MAYEPTNWKAGDTVTSVKLNKIEQGIAGGANILIVGATEEDNVTTLDKTWQEIYDADIAFVVKAEEDLKDIALVVGVGFNMGAYKVIAGSESYEAETADDYPVKSGGGK